MDWKMIESIALGVICGLALWYKWHPDKEQKPTTKNKYHDFLRDPCTYVLNKEEKAHYADILSRYNEDFDLKDGFMIMNKGKPYVYINGAFVPVKEEESPLNKVSFGL